MCMFTGTLCLEIHIFNIYSHTSRRYHSDDVFIYTFETAFASGKNVRLWRSPASYSELRDVIFQCSCTHIYTLRAESILFLLQDSLWTKAYQVMIWWICTWPGLENLTWIRPTVHVCKLRDLLCMANRSSECLSKYESLIRPLHIKNCYSYCRLWPSIYVFFRSHTLLLTAKLIARKVNPLEKFWKVYTHLSTFFEHLFKGRRKIWFIIVGQMCVYKL